LLRNRDFFVEKSQTNKKKFFFPPEKPGKPAGNSRSHAYFGFPVQNREYDFMLTKTVEPNLNKTFEIVGLQCVLHYIMSNLIPGFEGLTRAAG